MGVKSTVPTPALAFASMLGVATMAYAATGEFGNMCSLANHKDVKTDCSINSEFRGRTYCFSSRESQTNFMKDPSGNLAKAESFYKSAKASQTERLQRLHS